MIDNFNRFVLAKVLDGTLTRTRDLAPSTGLPAVPLTVLTRDPLSGAYNQVEFCAVRTVENASDSRKKPGWTPASPTTIRSI